MNVKVYKEWVPSLNEDMKKDGYWGLTLDRTRHPVDTIEVDDTKYDRRMNVYTVIIDGKEWTLLGALKQQRKRVSMNVEKELKVVRSLLARQITAKVDYKLYPKEARITVTAAKPEMTFDDLKQEVSSFERQVWRAMISIMASMSQDENFEDTSYNRDGLMRIGCGRGGLLFVKYVTVEYKYTGEDIWRDLGGYIQTGFKKANIKASVQTEVVEEEEIKPQGSTPVNERKKMSDDRMKKYEEATVSLGSIIKKKFPRNPWKYNKAAKAWIVEGESNVEKLYADLDKKYGEASGEVLRRKVLQDLGKRFEGYLIIADGQDSYFLIGLD